MLVSLVVEYKKHFHFLCVCVATAEKRNLIFDKEIVYVDEHILPQHVFKSFSSISFTFQVRHIFSNLRYTIFYLPHYFLSLDIG